MKDNNKIGVSSPRTPRGLHQSEGQQQDGDRHQEQVEDDTKVKDNNKFQGCHLVEGDIKVKDNETMR